MVLVVWDNWGEHVCRQLSSFLIGSSLSDVTISVGMKSIRTHRIILSFFSSYFKEMLDDIHEECPVIVVFPEVNFQALKIIIAYMYQGQINVPVDILPHVIELAKLLKVKGLLKLPTYLNSVIRGEEVRIANDQENLEQETEDNIDFGSEADGIVELEVTTGEEEPTISSNMRSMNSHTAVTVITNTSPNASPNRPLPSPTNSKEEEESVTSGRGVHKRGSGDANQVLIHSGDIHISSIGELTPAHIVNLSEDGAMGEVLFSSNYIEEEEDSLETDPIQKDSCSPLMEGAGQLKKKGDIICKTSKYGREDLVKALEDVKAGLGTLREIAQRWGVPRSTLSVSAKMAGISQMQKCSEYSLKALEEAKLAVKAGYSYMKAAKEFNIPKSVLWRKCQGEGIYRKSDHRFYNYNRENLLRARDMLISGRSLSDIVKETKIPKTSVFRLKEQLVREGKIPASSISRICRPRKPSEGSLHQAVMACTEEGMSLSQASEKLQVAKTTIWRRLKKLKQLGKSNTVLGVGGDQHKNITPTIKVEKPDSLNVAYDYDMTTKFCKEKESRIARQRKDNYVSLPSNYKQLECIKQKLGREGICLLKDKRVEVGALGSHLDSTESHSLMMEGDEGYLREDQTAIHAESPLSIKEECLTDEGSSNIAESNANTHFQLEMPLVNFHGGGYQVVGSEIVIGEQHMVVLDSSSSSQHDCNSNQHIVVTPFAAVDVRAAEESAVQMEGSSCVKQCDIEPQQNSFSSIYNQSKDVITVSTHPSQDIDSCLQAIKPDNSQQKCVPQDRMTALITEFMSVD